MATDASSPRVSPEPHAGYRRCVGLLLLDGAGRIFLGERRGAAGGAWQMPQGGIDPGETPAAAAWRELQEEVGTDAATLLSESLGWYAYDVPRRLRPAYWAGRYRGQTQKWLAFRFLGRDDEIDLEAAEPEFARWRWAPPAEVLRRAVDFKRPVYEAVLAEFAPLLEAPMPPGV